MRTASESERGSALTEAAIVFPCLVLIVYWSAALVDVMVLKLKAAEALRYSLWETTVFKPPEQIRSEVQEKFIDLRSARDQRLSSTGLSMYPLAKDLARSAEVDATSQRVWIGGTSRPPSRTGLGRWLNVAVRGLSRAVDAEMARERLNVHGAALARVSLTRGVHDHSSPVLQGGDLPGHRGANDLGVAPSMADLRFEAPTRSQRPMQLVFDSWKAWPKSAVYTFDGAPTDASVSPARTYPVVETQVSAQVGRIAFFGLGAQPWFSKLRDVGRTVLRALGSVAGGDLPEIFSSARMDDAGSDRGPITILPPQLPPEPWAPHICDHRGRSESCPTQRLGDLRASGSSPAYLDDGATLGNHVDRTRYTLPFAINTQYWTQGGGTNDGDRTGESARLSAPAAALSERNEYVRTWSCRGHFFVGSQRAQEPDVRRRYGRSCYR